MRKHTPRTILDPMAWITKRIPLADDQQRDIGIAYHVSLQAMLSGHGNEQAWCTLSCSLNIALMLAEAGYCAGAIPSIKCAQEAMMRSQERAQRTDRWAFDGDGIRSIQAALTIHDEQISRASKADVARAIRAVHQRIEANEVFA